MQRADGAHFQLIINILRISCNLSRGFLFHSTLVSDEHNFVS